VRSLPGAGLVPVPALPGRLGGVPHLPGGGGKRLVKMLTGAPTSDMGTDAVYDFPETRRASLRSISSRMARSVALVH
jgi:hypothetical protein